MISDSDANPDDADPEEIEAMILNGSCSGTEIVTTPEEATFLITAIETLKPFYMVIGCMALGLFLISTIRIIINKVTG